MIYDETVVQVCIIKLFKLMHIFQKKSELTCYILIRETELMQKVCASQT